ncbi:hypothetical protein, partial [Acetobacter syzygii]|uniref:hypothetical protein n=1 Tax=Acetobacter syzygii TaxID=146476 RepID=UPI001C528E94
GPISGLNAGACGPNKNGSNIKPAFGSPSQDGHKRSRNQLLKSIQNSLAVFIINPWIFLISVVNYPY